MPLALFINQYYVRFLQSHYRANPALHEKSYAEQMRSLLGEAFGDSDFYSRGLQQAGWGAEEFIVNCTPLQKRWAEENDFSGNGYEIAVEQVRRLKPDVLYIQDISMATKSILDLFRPHVGLIVGQIASPVPCNACLQGLDIVFSSFPHFVQRFRNAGLTSYYQPLAFDPRALDKLKPQNVRYPVSFIGGVTPHHRERKEFLERISSKIPFHFWGYGVDCFSEGSPVHRNYHGEAWGLAMFSRLSESFITINHHIGTAENYANNMRLFEATGCGALLVTDYKDNLNDLFEIGKEVAAYRSERECIALLGYFLKHPREAEEIALAGRRRTLREHTYASRMEHTAEILERHLRYKGESTSFPPIDMAKVSYGYNPIQPDDITNAMTCAWKSHEIPARQRALVQKELGDMYNGKVPPVYRILSESLKPCIVNGCSVLEIGCASGYYYEVLEYLLNRRIGYTGLDYSESLISMARDMYPKVRFLVADGSGLPFKDREFQVIISSGVLLHVPNYHRHIAETARVARSYIVAHRTPVCRSNPTRYFKKLAYGVETVEMLFNEEEFISLFLQSGFIRVHSSEYVSNPEHDAFEVTYVFSRGTGLN